MANKFALVSIKGGVGKTTVSANLGGILGDMRQRVLLIDADHQHSLSSYYTLPTKADYGLLNVVTTADATGCISKTTIDNLDRVFSDDPQKTINTWIRQRSSHFQHLNAALLKLYDAYDYIIIDAKGADGTGELHEMAIRASDVLLSPITPEWVAAKAFVRNTVHMLKRLEPPEGIPMTGPPIAPRFGLIYAMDRTKDARELALPLRKTVYDESHGKISILSTVVPRMAADNQAAGHRIPVHRYDVKRHGSTTASAYDTTLAFVHELRPHLSDVTPIIPKYADVATGG